MDALSSGTPLPDGPETYKLVPSRISSLADVANLFQTLQITFTVTTKEAKARLEISGNLWAETEPPAYYFADDEQEIPQNRS